MNDFMRLYIFSILFCLAISVACKPQSPIKGYVLTSLERHYRDSLKIDSSIIVSLRTQTDSAIVPFPKTLDYILNKDNDTVSSINQHPGILFHSSDNQTENIILKLYDDFQIKGYTIFILDRNFGIADKPDVIGVLNSTDLYEILKQVQTDGINWDIDNDSLLKIIKNFDNKYSLQLVGASGDWCEFKINKQPRDWMEIAKEAYKVCPDIVDQGSGTIKNLAEEMRQTKRLYFWWD